MPKDLPDLRAEARDGWWCLMLGEEKIATYFPTPAGRAAVEQVIENWRARRANGETDRQIIDAQGHRPTKPIRGTQKWLEAVVIEQAKEIETLKKHSDEQATEIENLNRLKHPREYGLDSVKHRREINPTPPWRAHVSSRNSSTTHRSSTRTSSNGSTATGVAGFEQVGAREW
jgi:hypothetical protein